MSDELESGVMLRVPRDGDYPRPPRWSRLYSKFFPKFTCPYSRHVKVVCEQMRRTDSRLRVAIDQVGFEPDHIASSMELTVKLLWEARAEIARLKSKED